MKTPTLFIPCVHRSLERSAFVSLLIGCFAISPAQAVSPPPDGGYPGGNTAEGQNALLSLSSGTYNTAIGAFSNLSLTTGNFNTGVGAGTLLSNSGGAFQQGSQNTATGAGALLSNTTGPFNTANGAFALFSNAVGPDNTATGAQTLFNNTTGGFNTANGAFAMPSNATGNDNTAIGFLALANNTTGSGNIALGINAGFGVTTVDNVICIGHNGQNVGNSCYIGQIFNATSSGGIAVFINSDGKLGTNTSSRRFKEDIKPMDHASEALFALEPVTFRYKKEIDPSGTPQLGLVAEDVDKVNSDLVVRDNDGKPYTVRYEQVNAMLLNEFLKEHRKVEEHETTIAQIKKELKATTAHQQKQIEALTAGLQKVSAQLEMSKPAPRTVLND
jgi:hypothetical protein